MATIYTRETGATAVNRALTNAELDNNFINLNADVATRILSSAKAAANGVATLDAAGKLLTAQLPTTGVAAGSYGSAVAIPVITVDDTGRLTLVSTVAVSIPSGSISVTGGDFTLSGNTGTAITNATLATVNSNIGTFNNVTVNAKGLVTAASNVSYLTALTDTLATVTGRGATTSTALTLTNSTASTTTGTGALIVAGGVGIGGAVNIGGKITGTLVSGELLSVGDTANATDKYISIKSQFGSLEIGRNGSTNAYVNSNMAVGTLDIIHNATKIQINAANTVLIPQSTASTSTTTGAFVVAGGVGIGGAVNVSGTGITYNGSTSGSTTLKAAAVAGSTTITLPAATGTLALASDFSPAKKQEFTATAGQTTFTITDGYVIGTVQVFANGIALAAADFTATNGTSVVLTEARVAGDNIIVTAGGVFQASSGTTTNALTISTGLTLNSGTTFNGSAARTLSLATSGVSAQTVGGSTSIPVLTVDIYGRITSVTTATPSGGGGGNSFANIYANAQGTTSNPLGSSPAVLINASSSSDTLYLFAGTNINITATSTPNKTITISSTAGGASSSNLSWVTSANSNPTNMSVPIPTGATAAGQTLWLLIVGSSISSNNINPPVSAGSAGSMTYQAGSGNAVLYSISSGSGLSGNIILSFNNYYNYAMATCWLTTTNSSNIPSGYVSGFGTGSTHFYSAPSMSYQKGPGKVFFVSNISMLDFTTAIPSPPSGWTSAGTQAHPLSANGLTVAVFNAPDPWTSSVTFNISNMNASSFTHGYAING